jgi:acylphosphatase
MFHWPNASDHPSAVIITPPTGANVYNITGFKLNSSDNTGLQGWVINISNDTINMQATTDVNGLYMFSGLSNGTYNITENPMTDWTNVSPSTIEVTVNGADLPNQNFTNMPTVPVIQPYVVSGFILNSSDNTGLQGWVINISNDTINMQATADVNGLYMFSGLSNGTYNITENPMTDWTNVSPSTIEVTVNGADLPNQNFTNMPTVPVIQPYVVSGFILNSSDNTGLQGWVINISNDTINMQATADVNGLYMFSGLSNGTYNITENPMTDWTNVSPSTIEVTVNGADLPNQNFTNILTAQPPVNAEVAYIVIVPYSVSLHTGEELQFHAQAYDANDTKIDANISYVIKNNQSNVGTITESGLFSALKSGSVRITASSGDISDTAVVTVTNIDHRNRHGNRHHNSGGWQEYIGAVN